MTTALSELVICLRDVREFLDNTPGGLGDACVEAAERLAALDALMPRFNAMKSSVDRRESDGEGLSVGETEILQDDLRDLLALRGQP